MIVLKFGGTSVGSARSIAQVVEIIENTPGHRFVVLSAFSGVTNILVTINEAYANGNATLIAAKLDELQNRCTEVVSELFQSSNYLQIANNFVQHTLDLIVRLTQESFAITHQKTIVAQGELISTTIVQLYLQEQQIASELLSALDFMTIDENREPNISEISALLSPKITEATSKSIYITQGFICRNHKGAIDNLERGGSDYTASLIGSALGAEVVQIWTDIDGMHNNDPRFVDNTFSIEEVSFDEAAELAYFGAKILHPQSLIPAKENNIPVLLKNTFNPDQKGTIISNTASRVGVTSIAAKDGITAIKIKSFRMLLAYGFLKKVFEVFETYKTPIDMITTSEVAVSLTIDNPAYLNEIVRELQAYGAVEVDHDLSIVCVAGNFSQKTEGLSAQVFSALKNIPVRMISYGGSNYNISLLVKTSDKKRALNALNVGLFKDRLTSELV